MTTWQTGEFKELLISRQLLEIELNKVHFWRLSFFEVFASEIQFFDQEIEFSEFRLVISISVGIVLSRIQSSHGKIPGIKSFFPRG